MSNPSVLTLQLASLVANGVCLSQMPAAAGTLTLDGSMVSGGIATFDVARRAAVASSANDATVVFTVTGTDRYGNAQTDTVTGVNAGSVNTALDFLTVTAVSSSAATVGNITVGTSGTGSTEWILDNYLANNWALSIAVSLSGAVTYTVEHTYDDPNKTGVSQVASPQQSSLEPRSYVPARVWPNGTLNGSTTDGETNYANNPIMAHRLTNTAGTGTATMQSLQAGITS